MNRLGPVREPIQNNEKIAPGEDGAAVPAEAKDRVGAAADKKLVDSLSGRDSLERFLAYMMASGTRN